MKDRFLASFLALAASAAFADDPYAGYVTLTKDDSSTSSTCSWNRPGNWSDGQTPTNTSNYYVPAGKLMQARGIGGAAGAWQGGQLVIGGTLVCNVNQKQSNRPSIAELVFLSGSLLKSSAYGLLQSPSHITVLADENDPMVIQTEYTGGGYPSRLGATVSGAPRTGIRVQASAAAATNGFFYLGGSFTNFHGTLTVSGGKINIMRTEADSGYLTFPGKLVVTDHAVFCPGYNTPKTVRKNVLLGALEVTDGGTLYMPSQNSGSATYITLGITNSIRIAEGGVVRITDVDASDLVNRSKDAANAGRGIRYRIANLSGDAVQNRDINDAVARVVNDDYNRAFGWKVYTEDGENGTRDVFVGVTNIATCTATLTNGAVPTNTSCWAGGVLPTEGVDFYFPHRFNPFYNWDFSNSKIILDTVGSGHYWCGGSTAMDLHAKEFHVLNSCTITLWAGSSYNRRIRGGPFYLAKGATFSFAFMDGCPSTRIESEVRGDGSLRMSMHKSEALRKFRFTLENMNTNWHGRLTVNAMKSSYTYNTILGDARNWGGEFRADEDCYSAVTLASNTCVWVTNNVCFRDPTRGFLLMKAPEFKVKEGFTLTLSNQVTYAGTVTKSDLGTLELGGTARFLDGQEATAPAANSNELVIAAGALKVSSKEACDGLAITFEEGTRLVIPAGSEDGLYDVKWDSPPAINTADGILTVEIAGDTAALPETFTTTIATLNATAAESIGVERFRLARVPNYTCTGLVKTAVADGVAYVATFMKSGLLMIVR